MKLRGKMLSCLVITLTAVKCSHAALITIEPIATLTTVDSAVTLKINIADVSDLYAFQFDVLFVPSVLSASSLAEGPFFMTGGFFPGIIDNNTGTIAFILNSLLGPVPGVDGGGTLMTVVFDAVGEGTSFVTVSNVLLLNSGLLDIPVTRIESASVTVTVVPEPTSSFVALGGLLLIALRKLVRA